MKTVFRLLVVIIVVTLPGCGETKLPGQKIVLFKDKVGIFLYDPIKQIANLTYKTSDQVFLEEPIALRKDTVVFAVKGELKTSLNNNGVEQYTKKYYSLCLSDGNSYLFRTVDYLISDRHLKIQTTTKQ